MMHGFQRVYYSVFSSCIVVFSAFLLWHFQCFHHAFFSIGKPHRPNFAELRRRKPEGHLTAMVRPSFGRSSPFGALRFCQSMSCADDARLLLARYPITRLMSSKMAGQFWRP